MPSFPVRGRHRRALTSLVLAGVVAAGCGEGAPADTPYAATVSALCEALTSDDRGAIEIAWNRAHGPLHDLASEVTEVDRADASDLLVAKNAVESTLRHDTSPPAIHDKIDRALTATRDALTTLGYPAPSC